MSVAKPKQFIPVGFGTMFYAFTGQNAPLGAAVTFAFKLGSSDNDPLSTASAFNASWGTHLKGVTSSELTLSAVHVKYGPNETGPFAEVSPNTAGTKAGSTSSCQVALLVRKNTGVGGRAGTGRIYYPGLIEADVGPGGLVTAAVVTAFQTAFNNWRGSLETNGRELCVAHIFGDITHSDGTTENRGGTPPDTIVSLAVQAQSATQRRRNRR